VQARVVVGWLAWLKSEREQRIVILWVATMTAKRSKWQQNSNDTMIGYKGMNRKIVERCSNDLNPPVKPNVAIVLMFDEVIYTASHAIVGGMSFRVYTPKYCFVRHDGHHTTQNVQRPYAVAQAMPHCKQETYIDSTKS
jgi:hypothetical protein